MSAANPSYDVRVIACHHCGAPVEGAITGGMFPCAHCNAVLRVEPRVELFEAFRQPSPPASAGLAPPRSRQERLARIRRALETGKYQDPWLNPPADVRRFLRVWVGDEALGEILSLWNADRQRLLANADPVAEVRFYWLTAALRGVLIPRHEYLRVRAFDETAADTVRGPVARTLLRTNLANRAADAGDLASADAWLRPIDEDSDVPAIHCTLTLARARLAYARGAWLDVLELVGRQADEVPFSSLYDLDACVWRAAALESSGDVPGAVAALDETRRGALGRLFTGITVKRVRGYVEAHPTRLCVVSFPAWLKRVRAARFRVASMVGVVAIAGLGCLGALGWYERGPGTTRPAPLHRHGSEQRRH